MGLGRGKFFGIGMRHVAFNVGRVCSGVHPGARYSTCREDVEIPGIGPKIAESVHEFFGYQKNAAVIERLRQGRRSA